MAHIDHIRHSLAHLLATAVKEFDPGVKLAIGPTIDTGFYYDLELGKPLSEKDFPALEKRMKALLKEKLSFERIDATAAQAREEFKDQPYKLELIDELENKGEKITLYQTGTFIDLCRGGHVENTSEIDPKSFKLDRIAGAYWRGSEKNKMLTRIYGLAFPSAEELAGFEAKREEARKRDHRKLGKELDLFVFSELVGSGMPLFTPRGNAIRREIVNYSRELNQELSFDEVHTPNINKAELFKISGHYDKYKEDMLKVSSQYVEDEMFLKPMNCPQHTQIYASQPRSYRDLPIRYADFATLYRDERPGELSGLTRLRAFAQDDGHIFCREDQIEEEIEKILGVVQKALQTYKIDSWMRLSLRDPQNKEKYLGADEVWEKSQSIMRGLLKAKKITHKEAEGEAAFYGPKIDIMAVDVLGREWQISTIQLDFNQPARFKLAYTDRDGAEKTPVMIHRALIGSPERFMGILIEHYAGAFPVWLAPVQVKVLPIGEAHLPYARGVFEGLKGAKLRAELDESAETLGKKIRNAKTEKVPYFLVIGDKEVEGETVTVEGREGQVGAMPLEDFIARVWDESGNRT